MSAFRYMHSVLTYSDDLEKKLFNPVDSGLQLQIWGREENMCVVDDSIILTLCSNNWMFWVSVYMDAYKIGPLWIFQELLSDKDEEVLIIVANEIYYLLLYRI